MLIALAFAVGLATCCLSAPTASKAFIFYYDFANDTGHKPASNVFPGEASTQVLSTLTAPEEFYTDFEPPLTSSGAYAPPPPPPPPSPSPVPSAPPSTGPYQPSFGIGQFPFFYPNNNNQGFSYFSYVSPTFQFFFMFM